MKRLFLVLSLIPLTPVLGTAQVVGAEDDSIRVVAGAQYDAGGWWRFWWGDHYREAWTTPITSAILRVGEFTGGEAPEAVGGGRQTRTLRLRARDGRRYYFRSLDKDPSEVLPPVLRTSIAADVLQDQISSQHPLAALVVSPLASAAGVPHTSPRLVTLADDPGLGEFREVFGGLPGLIEESADEQLSDLSAMGPPREVVGSETLVERLQGSTAERVSSSALLKARLLDFYVGDWDRHAAQWRWAAYDEGAAHVWIPIPLDRDQAFSRLDGVLPGLAQGFAPQFTGFGSDYDALSLHWNARFVDRRFLADLERPAFDSAAARLAEAVTDDVIDTALGRLPPEHQALDADRIAGHLKARRDGLRDAADRFYLLMASEVDVHGSNEPEVVRVAGDGGDAVEVVVAPIGAETQPRFRRTFHRGETKEVRIYLNGGDDRVRIRGGAALPIKVRVIGGGGADEVHFETATDGVSLYDVDGDTRVTGERAPGVNTRPYDDPPEIPDPMLPPHRDWGSWNLPQAAAGVSPDYGLKLGAGMTWYDYGFRKDPHASKVGLFGAVSTQLKYEVRLRSDFRFENSRAFLMAQLYATSFETVNFYGFGNDSRELPRDSAKVDRTASALELAVGSFPSNSTSFAVGPVLSFSRTFEDEESFINQIPFLYGGRDLWQVGAFARFDWDSRRDIRVSWTGEIPSLTGASFRAHGRYYPDWMDVVEPYGWLAGELRGYLRLPLLEDATHAAARIGGKKIWGEVPWYDAAFIGGPGSLRGWRSGRFAGDASLYGSAELRLHLLDGHFLVPSMWGLLGFADVGRVWVDGDSPGDAHWGFGGGLWWGLLGTKNVISLEVGVGEEDTTVYVQWAFAY